MHRDLAIAWVIWFCFLTLRKSQAETLAILAAAAMHVQQGSMAHIDRSMHGMAKHQIERRWRFCANERIETADAFAAVIRRSEAVL